MQGTHVDTKYEHYSMHIQWHVDEKVFILTVSELPGCVAGGMTYLEAVKWGQVAIKNWIDDRVAKGQPVPPPNILVIELDDDGKKECEDEEV